MALENDAVREAWRALLGHEPSSDELRHVVEVLGSREEFLAWLLLRRGAFDAEPALGQALQRVARAQHVAAATRRTDHGYPLDLERARAGLNESLLQLCGQAAAQADESWLDHARAVARAAGDAPMPLHLQLDIGRTP